MPWLRGDFHAHTLYSDGVLTPREFLKEAEREELDFFAITDHNTWTYPEFEKPHYMAIIAGVEVTMEYGHFNVFSEGDARPDWIDQLPQHPWPLRDPAIASGGSHELLETIKAEGLRSSINHPMTYPWEWLDDKTAISEMRMVEVWNDPSWPENQVANPAALQMWTRWLNAGSRATAVGGSDFHTPKALDRGDGWTVPGHRVGLPRTYVDANSNDPSTILQAVDAGRAYVTMGPMIEMNVRLREDEFSIGDRLGEVEGVADVWCRVSGRGQHAVELIGNGAVLASSTGKGGAGLEHSQPLEGDGWIRIDVRDEVTDQVVAFTNPIFFGKERPSGVFGDHVEETGWDLISKFAREQSPPS